MHICVCTDLSAKVLQNATPVLATAVVPVLASPPAAGGDIHGNGFTATSSSTRLVETAEVVANSSLSPAVVVPATDANKTQFLVASVLGGADDVATYAIDTDSLGWYNTCVRKQDMHGAKVL